MLKNRFMFIQFLVQYTLFLYYIVSRWISHLVDSLRPLALKIITELSTIDRMKLTSPTIRRAKSRQQGKDHE